MARPILNREISLKDFNDFYWLKKELVEFCKISEIPSSGGKLEIADRIRHYIKTGDVMEFSKVSIASKFDWNDERLSRKTIITDSYKNGENVRRFFTQEIGGHFSFNIVFMKWVKENIGRTLGDAIEEWKRINEIKRDKNSVSIIAPQFEYNRYMRDFLNDNSQMSSKDAMKYWKLKSSRRGTNKYERADLELT